MRATTKRQETKYIAGNDFYSNYSINRKLPYEQLNVKLPYQNGILNERLTYTSCQFPTYNKTLQYQSFSVKNKSLKAWLNYVLKNSNLFKMAELIF